MNHGLLARVDDGVSLLALGLLATALFVATALAPGWYRLLAGLLAVALSGFLLVVVTGAVRERRTQARAQLSYILTDARLLAYDAADGWSAQVFPGGLAGLARNRGNLELYLKEPEDPLVLFDLADIDTAERAIAKTLGPLP